MRIRYRLISTRDIQLEYNNKQAVQVYYFYINQITRVDKNI